MKVVPYFEKQHVAMLRCEMRLSLAEAGASLVSSLNSLDKCVTCNLGEDRAMSAMAHRE